MNIEDLHGYCLSKPETTEGIPFGEQTLVFKVGGKIFLLIGLEQANRFNAKNNKHHLTMNNTKK